jgi:hypothetical protein
MNNMQFSLQTAGGPETGWGSSMSIQVSGLLGLLHLILTIYAMVKIVQSNAGTGSKVLWIVVILLLPVLGLILWWLFGPKG